MFRSTFLRFCGLYNDDKRRKRMTIIQGVVTRVWPLRDTKEAGKKERYLDSELVFNLEVEENVVGLLV